MSKITESFFSMMIFIVIIGMIMVAVMWAVLGILIITCLLSFVFFIINLIKFIKIDKVTQKSNDICLKCNSRNIEIFYDFDDSWNYKCNECGNILEYNVDDDSYEESKLFIIVKLILLFITFLGTSLLLIFIINSWTYKNERENNIWLSNYSELSDFNYDYNEEFIYLHEYIGSSYNVYINSQYNIDGKIRKVKALDSIFDNKMLYSVIIYDGVDITSNTLNGISVDYLYLPKTINNDFSLNSFEIKKILYYAGSEEDWNTICGELCDKISQDNIVYNYNIKKAIKYSNK